MKKPRSQPITAPIVMFRITVIIFFSAALLLGVLNQFDFVVRGAAAVLYAAALLALAAAPTVYLLVYRALSEAESGVDEPAGMTLLAVTDALTQVMNRRGITMGVLEAMAQAERYNTPLSVAMVDVDHFQRINDEHGRATGDKVLSEFASVLSETLRMPDKVGRYGGEEFMVVLPHTGLTQARKIAERIRNAVANTKFSADGKRAGLAVSIGIAPYIKGKDLEHLLSRANAAVSEAKRDGGNKVIARKGR